jgi:ATP-binding cassette, subfamily B, bacterial MsbA
VSNIKMVFQFGWKYLRPYWNRLLAAILLGLLFGASNASMVWATKTLMERFDTAAQRRVAEATKEQDNKAGFFTGQARALQQQASAIIDPWLPRAGADWTWKMVVGGLLFLPLLMFMRSAADYGSSYCMGWVSERVVNDMRLDVMQKLSTLSLPFFNKAKSGDLLTRINGDTHKLHRALKQGSSELVKESITAIGLLGALLLMNWRLTLVAALFLPVCVVPLVVLGRKARQAARKSREAETKQASQLFELLNSVRLVKAYCLEESQMNRFRKQAREIVRQGMKGVQAKQLVNPIIEVIAMFGLGALLVVIFWMKTSLSDFVGFLTAVMLLFVAIKKLSSVHILFEQANPSVVRLAEIMQQQPTVKEPASPVRVSTFRNNICFEDVSFAYLDLPVLHNFSLEIPRGTKVGIAGPSGSGKSTVVNLLLRFYDPRSGRITIDGLDIREMSFRDLRQLIALVSQEVVLFDTSIAENIATGKLGASQAEIEAAARDAYAHEFIMQLPGGYQSRVGEKGVMLSGGQRQRIAIARAFVRNAPILVLDEATASLDSQAEAEVQRAIDHLAENRTVISVAHRLSTLSNCDQVIVLEQGRIVEQGHFEELLAAGGAFAAMGRRQGITPDLAGATSR